MLKFQLLDVPVPNNIILTLEGFIRGLEMCFSVLDLFKHSVRRIQFTILRYYLGKEHFHGLLRGLQRLVSGDDSPLPPLPRFPGKPGIKENFYLPTAFNLISE